MDTDLRLCKFFGLSNGYWLRAQAAYDTEVAELIVRLTKAMDEWKEKNIGTQRPRNHCPAS